MKKLLLNLTLLAFTFNQALAYTPSSEDLEISKALDEISAELDKEQVSLTQAKDKKLSEKKFNKIKAKALKNISKEIKKLEKMEQDEQLAYLIKKNTKQFKKIRKIAKKIKKRNGLRSKIAKKANISEEELISKINKVSSIYAEEEAVQVIRDRVSDYSGYENYLSGVKQEIESKTYNDYLIKIETASNTKSVKAGRSIASDGEWTIGLIVFGTIAIFAMAVALAVFFIAALIAGTFTPLVFVIGGVAGIGFLVYLFAS